MFLFFAQLKRVEFVCFIIENRLLLQETYVIVKKSRNLHVKHKDGEGSL